MAAKSKDTKMIIGAKEISRGVKSCAIKKVIVAKNCPKSATAKLGNVKIDVFEGDQTQLGTKLGKPFPVAMVGFSDIYAELK